MSGNDSDFIVEDGVLCEYIGSSDAVNIIIPDGMTRIGCKSFIGCINLKIVPSSVTSIHSSAFQSCRNLRSIELNPGVSLKPDSFNGCRGYLHDIFIENDQIERIKAILPPGQFNCPGK